VAARSRRRTPEIAGTGTALVTPFAKGRLDLRAVRRLVEQQIAAGVDFLVPCGTTGESPTLSDAERLSVIEAVVETSAGRVPVVAGTGTYDTHHSVELTRAAKKAGADACLAVSPYYNKPTQEGLYRHFRAMIDEGGLPAVLYHIPSRCVISIDVETVARTAEAGGVLGLKETGSVDRVTRLRERTSVPILSGDDGLTLAMMALGAIGVVSVASNVVPGAVRELVEECRAGEFGAARAAHDRLGPLFRALFLEPNPIPVKHAMRIAGLLKDDSVRLPLTPASPSVREALRAALD
jgi:4-hydroxy-tetrahydrodipicolinate synthase